MRLRRISLSGFKSFVDPTRLELPGDLIGIVGPNGCGKSNVIDAVRWVMGESSARQLRGELLADVIFNGAASRRPVGQASVELHFDNTGRRAGGRFAERDEISIRRVVNREGQSTYYLNGARCRRRDVTDLFLGTGLGPRSYAIIEQGTISRLIEARPEELRAFLEEAAGISLYRTRRQETETRMRQTEENLARLTDIRDELERQLARLKRQAAQAERYTKLKAEERRLRSELQALRWREHDEEARRADAAVRAQEVEVEASRARLRATEKELEQARDVHREATDSYNEKYRSTLEVRTEVGRAEEAIAQLRRQRGELEGALERDEHALKEAEAEAETDRARLEELRGRREAEGERVEQTRGQAGAAQEKLQEAERALAALREEQEQQRARWEAHARDLQAAEAAAQHHRVRLEEIGARLARLAEERDALAEAAPDEQLGQEVEALAAELAAAREQLRESQRAIAEIRERETEAAAALHGARERFEAMSGRIASLEALQQAALARRSGEAAQWLAANGLDARPRLTQLIEVAPTWGFAVECVLGSRLEAVQVPDAGRHASAFAALERATVSFVEERGDGVAASPGEAFPGGALVDEVSAGRELVASWLAGIGLAPTLEEALAGRARLAPHQSLITPDGTWVGPNWLRVFRPGDDEAGPLAREREIVEVRAALDALGDEVSGHQTHLREVRADLTRAEVERARLEAAWADANERYAELGSEHAARTAEAQARRRRHEEVTRELGELEDARVRLVRTREEEEQNLAALQASGETVAAERDEAGRRREALEAEVGARREAATRAHGEAHRAELEFASIGVQMEALEEAQERSRARMEALRAGMGESRERLAGIEAPIGEAEESLRARLEGHRAVEAELAGARERVESGEQAVRRHESERVAREAEVGQGRTVREELSGALTEARARRNAVAEQLTEAGFEVERVVAELTEEAAPDAWQEQLAGVERRIDRLGPINLAAVSEFESGSERKSYLDAQHEDLSEALATLKSAIARIDRETRERFRDTFERVGSKLGEIFPRLFGGGRASLELTGDDLLTAGVSVMAQPPGKRNTSIHLLSGGEKALAAIALVFAIFELNPAPFCILDEVDAPLDDVNVGRFVDLVNELSGRVQVILVTHNKTSMEAVTQLIGVTMNEPGVSRLVSVDMAQVLELVAS